jgi:hypothetical protein
MLILATLLACPLLSSGLLAEPPLDQSMPFSFRAYADNPTPFEYKVGSVEIVLRKDDSDSFYSYRVTLYRPVPVPPKKGISIELGPQPDIDPRLVVGEHVECA